MKFQAIYEKVNLRKLVNPQELPEVGIEELQINIRQGPAGLLARREMVGNPDEEVKGK